MSAMVETKRSRLNWTTAGKAAVTVGILGYLATKIDWGSLRNHLSSADPWWIAGAVFLFGAVMFGLSVRWWLLLRVQSVHLPLRTVGALTLIGQFFNAFLFGSTGGDVIKIFYILKYAPGRKALAALSLVLDRVLGIIVLLAFAVAVLPGQAAVLARDEQTATLAWALPLLFAAAVAGAVVMALFPFHHAPGPLRRFWEKIPRRDVVESLVGGFREHLRHPGTTLAVVAVASLIHFVNFAGGYCLARALGLDAGFGQMVVILATVFCLMSLPVSISGHGIREFAFVIMFSVYGLASKHDPEPAIAFSILWIGVSLLWSLIGGAVYLGFEHRGKARGTEL